MWRTFIRVVWILLILFNSISEFVASQPIIGIAKSCETDGEEIIIPGITNNPCIKCYCESGQVECRAEECPKLDCHVIKYEPGRCCPECQGCQTRDKYFNGSNTWSVDDEASCTLTNCKDRALTRSEIQCRVGCEKPTAPPFGECCPYCYGCVIRGKTYSEGEVFDSPIDKCTKCMCKNGRTTCSVKPCPVVACGKRRSRISKDGCCLECVGYKEITPPSDGKCFFRNRYIRNRKRIKADKCTKCRCQEGTMVCHRKSCPIKKCLESELIYQANRCCPKCPIKYLRDCQFRKEKYKHGEKWTYPEDPCLKYRCNNGSVSSSTTNCSLPSSCKPGEILDVIPGKCCKTCIQEPGICTVFGDPHYRTFDGRPFNFQGDCKYILSKDCLGKNFSVVVQNDGKHSRSFSWTKTVFLRLFATDLMPETQISLHQRLTVKLNGKKIFLPLRTAYYVIENVRGYVELKSTAGISLRWDGDSYLEVRASPKYHGILCGLCGNFNSFSRDDVIGGDGLLQRDDIAFAESWRESNNIFDCTRPDYNAKTNRPCGNSVTALLNAREKCLIFKTSAFRPCYARVDPMEYYESCLMDTCECPHNRKCSCESIRAYTEACSREGINILWNKRKYCRRTCKRGKVYSTCGPPCKMTCRNYENTKRNQRCLRRPCAAGCHCPAGQVLYRSRCIAINNCPRRLKNNPEHFTHNLTARKRFLQIVKNKR